MESAQFLILPGTTFCRTANSASAPALGSLIRGRLLVASAPSAVAMRTRRRFSSMRRPWSVCLSAGRGFSFACSMVARGVFATRCLGSEPGARFWSCVFFPESPGRACKSSQRAAGQNAGEPVLIRGS
jgi:hypothetical protein